MQGIRNTKNAIFRWEKDKLIPGALRIGGSLFWRRTDIEPYEARKVGAAAARKKAEREPSVTIADGAPEATKIARAVAMTGKLPEKCRSDWRTPFTHCENRYPPADVRESFGLSDFADWLDVADTLEKRIAPPSGLPSYGGFVAGVR